MLKFAKSFLRDESGASAAEYALILAVIGTAIAIGALALGGEITEAIDRAGDDVASANKAAKAGVAADDDGAAVVIPPNN
jgi:pilus assembly protein Flp/PilA